MSKEESIQDNNYREAERKADSNQSEDDNKSFTPFSHGRSDFTRNGRQNDLFLYNHQGFFLQNTVSNPLDFFNFSPKSLTIQLFLHRFEPEKVTFRMVRWTP